MKKYCNLSLLKTHAVAISELPYYFHTSCFKFDTKASRSKSVNVLSLDSSAIVNLVTGILILGHTRCIFHHSPIFIFLSPKCGNITGHRKTQKKDC